MRSLILTLLLLISSAVSAQVMQEVATNNAGQPFIRLYNNTPSWVSCYYRDSYNYFTFVIAPQAVSLWYPIYGMKFGQYEWKCI